MVWVAAKLWFYSLVAITVWTNVDRKNHSYCVLRPLYQEQLIWVMSYVQHIPPVSMVRFSKRMNLFSTLDLNASLSIFYLVCISCLSIGWQMTIWYCINTTQHCFFTQFGLCESSAWPLRFVSFSTKTHFGDALEFGCHDIIMVGVLTPEQCNRQFFGCSYLFLFWVDYELTVMSSFLALRLVFLNTYWVLDAYH